MKRSYLFSGIRFTSEIPLPEWAQFEVPTVFDRPDVVILVGTERIRPDAHEKFQVIGRDQYHFFVPDVGEYLVRNGREVLVVRAPGAGDSEIRLFLLGSALGALFYQRGLLALHASIVRTPAGAVAFCGSAGAGKSTLAAWMCADGFQFVSDDLCRFDVRPDGGAVVHPSTPRLKLWKDALDHLGHDETTLQRDHRRADKFHLGVAHADPRSAVPLAAIYVLDWADTVVIERMHGLNGLRALVAAASYRRDLFEQAGQHAAHWQRCVELASRVSLYRFARPRSAPEMAAAVEQLRAHIANHIGQPESVA